MNTLGLIIQRTNAGFSDVFISENLKEIRNTNEIDNSAIDERKYSTRLSNQSDVYTVQLTQNYRVYSLVKTNITDFVGGAGFYAIRLYINKKYVLSDFEERLNLINKKYIEFEKNGISKISQDYSELLKIETNFQINQPEFISVKSNENAFCLYDSNNTQLNNLFNTNSISLYNKIYAFNKEKAVSNEIIKSIGLLEFNSSVNNFKEVVINNPYRILKELKVNSISLEFKREITEFIIVLKIEDILEYNTTENPKFKSVNGLNVNIDKKQPAPPKQIPYKDGRNKKGFWEENGIYLSILLLTFMLAGGTWYYFERETVNNNKSTSIIVELPEIEIDSSNIVFEYDGNSKDSSVFKTSYSKLNKYRFRLDNKKWSYKNTKGKNKYVSFYKTDLDEIISSEKIALSDSLKNIFFINLEKISNQEIKKKDEIQITPSDDNSKKENKKADTEILEKQIKTESKTESKTKKETKKVTKKETKSKSNSEEIEIKIEN